MSCKRTQGRVNVSKLELISPHHNLQQYESQPKGSSVGGTLELRENSARKNMLNIHYQHTRELISRFCTSALGLVLFQIHVFTAQKILKHFARAAATTSATQPGVCDIVQTWCGQRRDVSAPRWCCPSSPHHRSSETGPPPAPAPLQSEHSARSSSSFITLTVPGQEAASSHLQCQVKKQLHHTYSARSRSSFITLTVPGQAAASSHLQWQVKEQLHHTYSDRSKNSFTVIVGQAVTSKSSFIAMIGQAVTSQGH